MKPSTVFVLAGVTLALAACNRTDPNRTTSVPNGVKDPLAITAPIVSPSAPPAPAERGPIPANANAAAPGTNASVAFADAAAGNAAVHLPPSKEGAPASQAEVAKVQLGVAQASDTEKGDAAKKAAMSSGTQGSEPATTRDTAANNPRGALTAQQESTGMPKAGQGNNYSSPALEKDSGRPSR
ncbi:MAG: hypothetical protein M3R40_01840 [Pseudomonadota bacterium]|nr:hypothetical protein [Pseudomonadota bacterium]